MWVSLTVCTRALPCGEIKCPHPIWSVSLQKMSRLHQFILWLYINLPHKNDFISDSWKTYNNGSLIFHYTLMVAVNHPQKAQLVIGHNSSRLRWESQKRVLWIIFWAANWFSFIIFYTDIGSSMDLSFTLYFICKRNWYLEKYREGWA